LGRWKTDGTADRVHNRRKPAAQCGFAVLPRRWVVKRTLGWLMRDD